jgi:hypothetical protein
MKNCSTWCGCSVDHIYSSDDSAQKLVEDEGNHCRSWPPLGVLFEDYLTCDMLWRFVEPQCQLCFGSALDLARRRMGSGGGGGGGGGGSSIFGCIGSLVIGLKVHMP